MVVVIKNGVKFKDSSICYKIYCLYFEQHISKETIPGILNISSTRVNETIKWLNGKFQHDNRGVIIVDEVSSLVPRQTVQQTLAPKPENTDLSLKENEILKICTFEENNKYYVYVRTNDKFEEHLQSIKHTRTTERLWGDNASATYYYGKCFDNYRKVDDINRPILVENKINFAILRVVGISKGFKAEITQLVTQEKLKKAILAFRTDFKDYYAAKIKNVANSTAITYSLKDSNTEDGIVRVCANCHKEFNAAIHHINPINTQDAN